MESDEENRNEMIEMHDVKLDVDKNYLDANPDNMNVAEVEDL